MADPSCPRSYDYFLLAEAQRREANDNGNRHSLDDVLAEMLMKPRASDALLRAMVDAASSIREEVARAIAATEYDKDRWDELGECQREGYRANADAAITATLNALLADLDERGFSIALWQPHVRSDIRNWIEGHREGQKWSYPR